MLSYEPAGAVSTLVVLPARAAHAVVSKYSPFFAS
jgi:hypothetical protein